MDLMTAIMAIPGVGPYVPYIMLAVVVCALLAAALPAPTAANSVAYVIFYRFINTVGINIFKAKNAGDTGAVVKVASPTLPVGLLALILLAGVLAACSQTQVSDARAACAAEGLVITADPALAGLEPQLADAIQGGCTVIDQTPAP